MATKSDLMKASEVAERLNCSVKTVLRMVEQQRIPYAKGYIKLTHSRSSLRFKRDFIERLANGEHDLETIKAHG